MKNPIFKAALALLMSLLVSTTAFSQRQVENLNRGVVAVKERSTQVYVSWRLFGSDPTAVAFNLYRSATRGAATKLNASPFTTTMDDFGAWEILNPGGDPESVRATYSLPVPKPAASFIRLRFEK